MAKTTLIVHLTAYFSGRVQGVGFRYTVYQVAKEFEISGIVRNRTDGRVELEAEGSAAEVEAFLAAIEDRLDGFIREVEKSIENRPASFRGFSIR